MGFCFHHKPETLYPLNPTDPISGVLWSTLRIKYFVEKHPKKSVTFYEYSVIVCFCADFHFVYLPGFTFLDY